MDEVTDVILTHLHFDHSGGAVVWNEDRSGYRPAFPNAVYWSHAAHWAHACDPNPREKPSFLKENFLPIQEAGQLRFVESGLELGPDIQMRTVNGHTVSMMCPQIRYKGETLLYCADLIPSASHIPVNYVMGYDIEPLKTMQEKSALLAEAQANNWLLFYEHDPRTVMSKVLLNEKGAYHSGNAVLPEEL
jgi:glyoxylase-like metal-dependent hydrolase (beta-lactamase superfamily II)